MIGTNNGIQHSNDNPTIAIPAVKTGSRSSLTDDCPSLVPTAKVLTTILPDFQGYAVMNSGGGYGLHKRSAIGIVTKLAIKWEELFGSTRKTCSFTAGERSADRGAVRRRR